MVTETAEVLHLPKLGRISLVEIVGVSYAPWNFMCWKSGRYGSEHGIDVDCTNIYLNYKVPEKRYGPSVAHHPLRQIRRTWGCGPLRIAGYFCGTKRTRIQFPSNIAMFTSHDPVSMLDDHISLNVPWLLSNSHQSGVHFTWVGLYSVSPRPYLRWKSLCKSDGLY